MKKIFNIIPLILLVVMGVSVTSCDKEEPFNNQEDGATGTVSFRKMLVEIRNEENVMRSTQVDVNAFIVTVTDSRTGEVKWEGTYGSMPEVMTLAVGNYKVKVNSADNPDAGWDSPYFEGSQDFSITEGTISTVDPVVCKLANVKVTVIFDKELLAKMGSDCKVSVVACDKGHLEFTPSETRSGYFKYIATPGSESTLVATFSGTVDENYEENFRTYTAVAPGNHYKITYTLKGVNPNIPDQTGIVTPGVYVDATVERVDMTVNVDVEDDILKDDMRPGEEDPDNPPTPGNPTPDITASSGISFESPNTVTPGMEAVVKVHSHAEGGLTGFTVDIESNTLTPQELEGVGLASHLDLVNPGQFAESLAGLGFPVNVGGQTDPDPMVLTDFLPMLQALGAGTHKFVLKVTDANGTTDKTLTFITL